MAERAGGIEPTEAQSSDMSGLGRIAFLDAHSALRPGDANSLQILRRPQLA